MNDYHQTDCRSLMDWSRLPKPFRLSG
jgi:hypothetical protein